MAFVVRVWDAPTRLFHWLLAFCVASLLISGNVGGGAMQWHLRFGYGTLTLLLFRLIWGVAGGHWSRFSSFFYSPRHIWNFLHGRTEPSDHIGHNPLGSLSIIAMLLFLSLQITSGMMSDDEIATAGPLVAHVSGSWVSYATFYHKAIGKWVLLGLVAMHLVAVGFHFFVKRDNLVKPMLSGDKTLPIEAVSSIDSATRRFLALTIVSICSASVAALVYWLER